MSAAGSMKVGTSVLNFVDLHRLGIAGWVVACLALQLALDRVLLRADLLDVAGLDLVDEERLVGDPLAIRGAARDERDHEVQRQQPDQDRDELPAARDHRRLALGHGSASAGSGIDPLAGALRLLGGGVSADESVRSPTVLLRRTAAATDGDRARLRAQKGLWSLSGSPCRRDTARAMSQENVSWSGRALRLTAPVTASCVLPKTWICPDMSRFPTLSRFAVARISGASSPKPTRDGKAARVQCSAKSSPWATRSWSAATGEAEAEPVGSTCAQPDCRLHRPRRADRQDRVLLRTRAGPRSPGPIGVGDVEGERGDRRSI